MMAYRICWMLFCGLLGALGAVMALTWSLTNVIVVLGMASLTGAVVAMVALADADRPKRPPQEQRRIVARSTALAAGGTLSFIGLGALVGAATAVLLLVIAVGGSPYVIRYCVRWLSEHGHFASLSPLSVRPNPADPSPQSAPAPILRTEPEHASKPHVAPGALSDEALCVAWRASFSALQRAGSPTQRLRVVDQRREYLDEIERRTADGMAAWLASGPRAAGDPSRFVLGDGAAGRARIDWDDLLQDTDK